jgi:NAD(P)-dependent dehydrogenase (short-subunit alcohol dehydrogenase family)
MPALPDLDGKVALVTGANTGIGKVTALELARAGAQVYLACRSAEKTAPVVEEIRGATEATRAEFIPLDLASLASVRACAADFLARGRPLHILVNNAGVAGQRGLTADGFELTFGVNHLGPFLLTMLLLERLKASAPARVVTVSSQAHYGAKGIPWERVRRPTRTLTGLSEYGVSKLANVLFSAELARRLEGSGVTTYSLHPGVIASDIWRRMPAPLRVVAKAFMRSNEEGARTSLHCATAPELIAETGLYYDSCRPRKPGRAARDAQLAHELWTRSLDWTQLSDS